MSADISSGEGAGPLGGLSVRALFKVSDEKSAQAVAARMVDRAHEIANMPDCECDVDVSVEWTPPDGLTGAVELAAESAHGRPGDR